MNRANRAALTGLGLLAAALGTALSGSPSLADEAQVTLRLVDPENPALLIVNDSGVEAEGINYAFGLWNADTLQDGHEMLPLPRGDLDRLAPHSRQGPIDFFNTPELRGLLKSGNRIVGGIAVHCRNCARGYTYWVLITWQEGGWFSEIKGITNGNLVVPTYTDNGEMMRGYELKGALLQNAAEVEQKDRIPIAPLKP